MILYHGTNIDFKSIDLSFSKNFKDFGKGFYLTDIQRQAYDLALQRVRIGGGNAIVQEYEFDETNLTNGSLSVLQFKEPTAEWADFIFKNRTRSLNFTHNYDIVYGPIADDGVAYLLNLYEEGLRTLDELAKELKYKKLNSQYCFENEKATRLLRRIK